jgi:hypothetical protein
MHQFDYLRGGEGPSRAKRAVGGVGEAHNQGCRRSGRGRWRALGEAVEVNGLLRGRWRRRAPGEAIEVNGLLRGRRRRRAPGEAVEVDGVLWAKRSRLMVCSGRSGRGRGQSDRAVSRAKWLRECSGGEAVEGVLRR